MSPGPTTPADNALMDDPASDPADGARTRALRASYDTERDQARVRAEAAEQPGPAQAARTMTALLRTALGREAPTASAPRRDALEVRLGHLRANDDPFVAAEVSEGDRVVLSRGLVHDDDLRGQLLVADVQGMRAMQHEKAQTEARAAALLDRHRAEDGRLDAQGMRTEIGTGLRTTIDALSKDRSADIPRKDLLTLRAIHRTTDKAIASEEGISGEEIHYVAGRLGAISATRSDAGRLEAATAQAGLSMIEREATRGRQAVAPRPARRRDDPLSL